MKRSFRSKDSSLFPTSASTPLSLVLNGLFLQSVHDAECFPPSILLYYICLMHCLALLTFFAFRFFFTIQKLF